MGQMGLNQEELQQEKLTQKLRNGMRHPTDLNPTLLKKRVVVL